MKKYLQIFLPDGKRTDAYHASGRLYARIKTFSLRYYNWSYRK